MYILQFKLNVKMYINYDVFFLCYSLQPIRAKRSCYAGCSCSGFIRHLAFLCKHVPNAVCHAMVPREGNINILYFYISLHATENAIGRYIGQALFHINGCFPLNVIGTILDTRISNTNVSMEFYSDGQLCNCWVNETVK